MYVVCDNAELSVLAAAAAAASPSTDQAHAAWNREHKKRQEEGEPKPALTSSSLKKVRPKTLFFREKKNTKTPTCLYQQRAYCTVLTINSRTSERNVRVYIISSLRLRSNSPSGLAQYADNNPQTPSTTPRNLYRSGSRSEL